MPQFTVRWWKGYWDWAYQLVAYTSRPIVSQYIQKVFNLRLSKFLIWKQRSIRKVSIQGTHPPTQPSNTGLLARIQAGQPWSKFGLSQNVANVSNSILSIETFICMWSLTLYYEISTKKNTLCRAWLSWYCTSM
jgi:hypothetical protein